MSSSTSQDCLDDAAIDEIAASGFVDRYGEVSLGPVCIVIAAYREAASLANVVRTLPAEVDRLATRVLVIDDGSDDDTATVACEAGAFLCRTPVNRGQGAALRLGYALARARGATCIVTTDADGQYDPADIARVARPVISGHADFVSGSRRLGRTYQGDGLRRLGVVVYAAFISVLIRHRVTDPSFGLRALNPTVTERVELRQQQYQAAELLIGAAMRGFRLAEVPATMHARDAGGSRKGHDLLYGARFGRVVLGTWWREHRRQ
jgi:glycosyltransferase involved in cell wall biosynthesis